MKFSEHFEVERKPKDNWFDPVMSIDTLLFIDPFLIYDNEIGPFRGSHKEIVAFFTSMFGLIAQSGGHKQSIRYRKAEASLIFPEAEEICLGFTHGGTAGAGSGSEIGKLMAEAIWEAIQAGLDNIDHFEEVAIIRENVGRDRISDATVKILRHRFAAYTLAVCRRHKIPVRPFRYDQGRFDPKSNRWVMAKFDLPINPYNGKALLLVPEDYLRELPTIESADFWKYCVRFKANILRDEFNFDLVTKVPKSQIVEVARKHIEWVREYVNYREQRQGKPYNLKKDSRGLVKWYAMAKSYCAFHPLSIPIQNKNDLRQAIVEMIGEFQHFVQENAGWKLLWNDNGSNKSEHAAQLLFLGIVKHYCHAAGIEISKEPNIGRGPVDFKFSTHGVALLLELKLAKNTKFWNGLRKQLPTYLKAEKIDSGFYVVVLFSENDKKRIAGVKRVTSSVAKRTNLKISTVSVNAIPGKPSASKL
jgi:hypothetical protein